MAISTNPEPTIYRNLYENTDPGELQLSTTERYLRCGKIYVNISHVDYSQHFGI